MYFDVLSRRAMMLASPGARRRGVVNLKNAVKMGGTFVSHAPGDRLNRVIGAREQLASNGESGLRDPFDHGVACLLFDDRGRVRSAAMHVTRNVRKRDALGGILGYKRQRLWTQRRSGQGLASAGSAGRGALQDCCDEREISRDRQFRQRPGRRQFLRQSFQ